jgi:hypothetical protein
MNGISVRVGTSDILKKESVLKYRRSFSKSLLLKAQHEEEMQDVPT